MIMLEGALCGPIEPHQQKSKRYYIGLEKSHAGTAWASHATNASWFESVVPCGNEYHYAAHV